MSLYLPSQIVADELLPTVRGQVCVELATRGLTQEEIAAPLGITQAMVSRYLNEGIDEAPHFAERPQLQRTVGRLVDGIISEEADSVDVLVECMTLAETFKANGVLCERHAELMPTLDPEACDLCTDRTDSKFVAARQVKESVRRATRQFLDDALVQFVPSVGTNIAMATAAPEGPADVAAIPGRIHRAHPQTRTRDPRFGASRHVAGLILAATAADPTLRGGINLQTSTSLIETAARRGLPVKRFAPMADRDGGFDIVIEDPAEVPRIWYHTGTHGVEPMTYVLGTTAVDAVETAAELATG